MNKKIYIILPYKESLDSNKAGAVSLYVTGNKKFSKYKKNIKIISSEDSINFNLFTNRSYIVNFCKNNKNKKIDLIEIHNRPEYVKYIKNTFPNSKITLTFHNDPLNLRKSKKKNERKYLIKTCSKIIFISRWIQQRFFIELKNSSYIKTDIVYHAVNIHKLKKINKKKNIVFVGKLNEAKGYHIFADAAKKFKAINKGWNFIAVGNEPRKKIFPNKKIINEIGYKSNNYILNLYQNSEISVGNSKWNEPLGRLAIESSSRKCLPIISDVAGLKESKSIAYVLKNNNSTELFKVLKILTKKNLLRKKLQNQFYDNNKLSIQFTSKQTDKIRFNILHSLINNNKLKKIKVLHIANFNELSEGRLYYSFANKLNNGFLKNNNLVLAFSDRYFLKNNKSLLDPRGNIKLFNRKIMNYLKNFAPDILLVGHVFNINDEVFDYCKENNIKTAAWFIDSISNEFFNINKKKLFMNNLRKVDNYFITSSPKKLKNFRNYKKIKYIPNPCDDLIDINKNFENPNLEYDLFIAISHGQNRGLLKKGKIDEREKTLTYLTKNLPTIKFAEFGYKGIEPIWGDNYFYYLKKSKMSLNISRGKYQYLYSSDRISSLIGNGLLVFTSNKTKMNKFLDKNEVIYYSDKKDLVKKILFYSEHDRLRSQIAKKGYLKYHKYFSNKIVANYICGETGLSQKTNPIWKQ